MSPPLLEVSQLHTQFSLRQGILRAVDGVSFSLSAGQTLGIVGESGSGKSVTGFSLLGLIDPPGEIVASSSIRLNGKELVGSDAASWRQIRGQQMAMVFQDPMSTLNPVLTVERQMFLALAAHEKISPNAARSRSLSVLQKVGMPDPEARLKAYPHQLSGGMRQRVAIAMALLFQPKVLICDEPTTALDVSVQAQIMMQMKALVVEADTALIWISHDLATVSHMAEELIVMYAGRIVEKGKTQEILESPRHPYTEALLQALPDQATPGTPLHAISGNMPSLQNLPTGCAFAPRCAYAHAACQEKPLLQQNGSRSVACHAPLEQQRTASVISLAAQEQV